VNSSTSYRALALLAGVFLLGVAAGRAFDIGGIVVAWIAVLSGIGLSIPSVWQSITAERSLRLQQVQHAAQLAVRDAEQERTRQDLQAIAQQAYQRAARSLRTMPAGPFDTWFEWGDLFGLVCGRELRGLFLELQRAASQAGGASAETGRQVHANFLELERTVDSITKPSEDPRSPPELVQRALELRGLLRVGLTDLGAQPDRASDF
jgi:hypothetical protein